MSGAKAKVSTNAGVSYAVAGESGLRRNDALPIARA